MIPICRHLLQVHICMRALGDFPTVYTMCGDRLGFLSLSAPLQDIISFSSFHHSFPHCTFLSHTARSIIIYVLLRSTNCGTRRHINFFPSRFSDTHIWAGDAFKRKKVNFCHIWKFLKFVMTSKNRSQVSIIDDRRDKNRAAGHLI